MKTQIGWHSHPKGHISTPTTSYTKKEQTHVRNDLQAKKNKEPTPTQVENKAQLTIVCPTPIVSPTRTIKKRVLETFCSVSSDTGHMALHLKGIVM